MFLEKNLISLITKKIIYTNLRSQGYSAARCSMQGIVQYKGFFTVIVVYSVMNPYLLLKDMD